MRRSVEDARADGRKIIRYPAVQIAGKCVPANALIRGRHLFAMQFVAAQIKDVRAVIVAAITPEPFNSSAGRP